MKAQKTVDSHNAKTRGKALLDTVPDWVIILFMLMLALALLGVLVAFM